MRVSSTLCNNPVRLSSCRASSGRHLTEIMASWTQVSNCVQARNEQTYSAIYSVRELPALAVPAKTDLILVFGSVAAPAGTQPALVWSPIPPSHRHGVVLDLPYQDLINSRARNEASVRGE